MSRLERIIVGVFICVTSSSSLFVLGWWTSAGLGIYHLLPISDQGIAIAALSSLGIGILLNVLCLKSLMARFYDVDWRIAAPIYLFWVMIATASFMGVPLGTLVLGTLAGLYLGRRYRHGRTSKITFARQVTIASLCVALVTGVASLGIGMLVLRDAYALAAIQRVLGTRPGASTLAAGAGFALVSCMVLVALQYKCTKTAAVFAFRWGEQA